MFDDQLEQLEGMMQDCDRLIIELRELDGGQVADGFLLQARGALKTAFDRLLQEWSSSMEQQL